MLAQVYKVNDWHFLHFQIQTAGGGLFQDGTVCTETVYDPAELPEGGGAIAYYARDQEPSGPYINVTGELINLLRYLT